MSKYRNEAGIGKGFPKRARSGTWAGGKVGRLVDWLIGRLVTRLLGWLAVWLNDDLVK